MMNSEAVYIDGIPVSSPEPLIDAKVAAPVLGISPAGLLLKARHGEIPSYKFGPKTIRFHMSDIIEYANKSRRGRWNEGSGRGRVL